jgi:hypothetical protein
VLGDGYGNLYDTAAGDNFLYCQVGGDRIATVYNTRVQPRMGIRVWVGYDPLEPGLYQVLSTRSNSAGVIVQAGFAPASYYSFYGGDPLYVQLRQFMPFRPWVTNSDMILHVYRGFVLTSTGPKFVDIQTTDLTAYIPTAYDTGALVLITINTAGTLTVTDGADVSPLSNLVTTTTLTNLPAIPVDTAYVICAVKVFRETTGAPQTLIYEPMAVSGSNEDIRNDLADLRLMNDVSTGGMALNIHGATAKTTPVSADEFPLADSAASWVLKKITFSNILAGIQAGFAWATAVSITTANGAGSGTDGARANHTHQGVHSLAKLGDAAIYGDVTLSGSGAVILTESGQNIIFDLASVGEVSGLARWNADGGATFELPDVAERIMLVSNAGSVVDPFLYTLTGETQLVFDSAPTAGNVVVCDYVVKQG